MSKIFVTGGAGFIGNCVVRKLLTKGYDVALFDSFINYTYPLNKTHLYHNSKRMEGIIDSARIIRGNICGYDFLRRSLLECNPDIIIHLAALPLANLAIEQPEDAVKTILNGTMNLLQVARDLNNLERFVYISSSMVYGDFITIPASEDHPKNPKDVYGSMKLAGEMLTRSFGLLFEFDYTVVRPSSVYGPTDNNRRVVSLFLENALSGKPLIVRGGDQYLDFTFVTDASEGIVITAEKNEAVGKCFNITNGQGRSIFEAAEIIAKLIPGTDIVIEEADSKIPSRGSLDITKARTLLDFKPEVTLEKGIETYLDFIRTRKSEIGE